ncbi:MAG TPA: FecR domain-containing protein [Bryobacteraceae bacterium]|nr:FecR domain-containing protein [Bryobacteraceae bacterium]
MFTVRHFVGTLSCFALSASLCLAQNIAPSHSGTVDYFEGDVSIDGLQLVSKAARFSSVKEQSVLKTGEGRAEILLTPGVILRVGANSSIRMLDSSLMHTQVQLVSGTAMAEAAESDTDVKDPPVTILYNGTQTQPVKYGIFEITSDPAQVRVFKGEARVSNSNDGWKNVKDGNQVSLTETLATAKFDDKVADDLFLWSRDRSSYLSAANISSARTLATANRTYGGYGALGWDAMMWNGFSGGWYFNPYLNMYSFIPFGGMMMSPFGYDYFNPMTVGYFYTPTYYWSGAGGARTGTTAGVPLTTAATKTLGLRSGSNAPALPRLGTTATLRPTVNSPLRGALTPAAANLGGRNTGLFAARNGNQPVFNNNVSNVNNSISRAPAMSAPSAAPMSAPSAGARVGASRR